jgi:hypothetical protein
MGNIGRVAHISLLLGNVGHPPRAAIDTYYLKGGAGTAVCALCTHTEGF